MDKLTPAAIVATIVCLGFFASMVALFSVAVPVTNLTTLMVTTLAASFIAVVQYFFGSSHGSVQKTDQITKLVEANTALTAQTAAAVAAVVPATVAAPTTPAA